MASASPKKARKPPAKQTPKKLRVRLIHGKEAEGEVRAAELRTLGYAVDYARMSGVELKKIRKNLPDAFIVDLTRTPFNMRYFAMLMRQGRTTRFVPLVIADGAPEKVALLRKDIPDATYTTWAKLPGALKQAIANPLAHPAKPAASAIGHTDTPLWKKVGLRPSITVNLINAPDAFEELLQPAPDGVEFVYDARTPTDLVFWFVESFRDLQGGMRRILPLGGKNGLWIAWPKQGSGADTDLNQNVVRETGRAFDMIDFKICSLDKTWSAMRFSRRNA